MNRRPHFPKLLLLSCLLHSAAFAFVSFEPAAEIPTLSGDLSVALVPITEHVEKSAEPVTEEVPPPSLPPVPEAPEPPKPEKQAILPKPKKKPEPKPQKTEEIKKEQPKEEPVVKAAAPSYPAPVKNIPQSARARLSHEVKANYEAQLLAWLERHKQYPRTARRRGQEGEALIRITITRGGKVLNSTIEKSTGTSLLDRAVEQMTAKANPFPPMPDNYPGQTLTFRVPVQFNLR